MMILDHPNMKGFKCPVCETGEDKPVTLVPIEGVLEGYDMEDVQIHIDCIELSIQNDEEQEQYTYLIQHM